MLQQKHKVHDLTRPGPRPGELQSIVSTFLLEYVVSLLEYVVFLSRKGSCHCSADGQGIASAAAGIGHSSTGTVAIIGHTGRVHKEIYSASSEFQLKNSVGLNLGFSVFILYLSDLLIGGGFVTGITFTTHL